MIGVGAGIALPPILLISDRHQALLPLDTIFDAALEAGIGWISLREKDWSPADRRPILDRLVARSAPLGAWVGLHGDASEARQAGLVRVHLARDGDLSAARATLGPQGLIGISAHDVGEALAAERKGADYVSVSPIFASASKPGYGPQIGLDGLALIASRLTIPVVALGGIDASQIAACLTAGAASVAIMGSVMRSADPRRICAALIAAARAASA